MEDNHVEDESPTDFQFPMSKRSKINHANFESNIKSIIEDDEDDVKSSTLSERKSNPIVAQKLSADNGECDVDNAERKFRNVNLEEKSNSEKDNSSSPNINNKDAEKKKLSILSNGYRPKKTTKKGKLK